MDPDKVRELIEGQQDILTDMADKDSKIYTEATCPNCHDQQCYKKINPPEIQTDHTGETVFSYKFEKNGMLRGVACCLQCGTEFDPRSGVIQKSPPILTTPE